jgi:ATP-binding cassette subfamily B protein
MARYLRPFFKRMSVGLTIKITATMLELALPYILNYILKNVVADGKISSVIYWGLLMMVCAFAACVGNIIANRMAARVARNFSESVRKDLFDRSIRLSAAQTDRFTIASLESRITTDTYNVHNFVGMMQRMGVRAPILLIGGTAITLFMDRRLSLVMLAILPFIFVTVYFISRRGVPLYTRVQQSVDGMVRVVREDVGGIRVIKALSKDSYEHSRYDKVNKALIKDETKAGVTMGAVNPIMTVLMNLGIVSVTAMAASSVNGGTSDPETIIAFIQYFTLISNAMMSVTRIFVMYTKSAASARRIAEVIDAPEDMAVGAESEYPGIETNDYIVFKDVSFSYNGVKNNLEDINLRVGKGGSLGIIGATGSGKSTLVKLLMRFYDVSSGGIYIDGQDIRTVPKEKLYSMFGSAMQNDFLYADTIEENIRFGRDITHDEIVSAAKTAQAEEFINATPDGFGHMLAVKGQNLSGGQKQRLLISRAVAGKPDILILDDSSSALDYKTDANLRRALASDMQGTTVITVAQRVSSVKSCDCILLISDGRISGIGTHEELLRTCAEYREISESQMGGDFVE